MHFRTKITILCFKLFYNLRMVRLKTRHFIQLLSLHLRYQIFIMALRIGYGLRVVLKKILSIERCHDGTNQLKTENDEASNQRPVLQRNRPYGAENRHGEGRKQDNEERGNEGNFGGLHSVLPNATIRHAAPDSNQLKP